MDATWVTVDAGAIAATLVHFVWQGFVVAAAAATLVWVARPRTAHARYAIYCATLAVLAACPVLTLALVAGRVADASSTFALSNSEVESTAGVVVQSSPYAPQRVVAAKWSFSDSVDDAARWLESQRHLILTVWGIGCGFGLLRVAAGSVHVWRIARRGRPLPAELQSAVERLGGRLRFRRLPAVRVVDEISQAMAVGIVRPMVLLPAAWVSGLSGEMLEAVIAHELAHLRRWDLLINVLQRVVESVLFFHPVVWWCSRKIRVEREMCCDEAAVAAIGDRVMYVKALSHLAEHAVVACEPAWALGIGGSKMVLFERIRNVLGLGSTGHGQWYGPSCAVIGAAMASLVWGVVLISTESEQTVVHAAGVNNAQPEGERAYGIPVGDPENRVFRRVQPGELPNYPGRADATRNHFPKGPFDNEVRQTPPVKDWDATAQRFVHGEGVNSNAGTTGLIENAPSEHKKVLLPSYTIEPPDILTIDVSRIAPNAAYRLHPGVQLEVTVVPREANVAVGACSVEEAGNIDLGPRWGELKVNGLTPSEVADAVTKLLKPTYKRATVSVEIVKGAIVQPIAGEHLVSPDGTVNLGSYGQVLVAGLTLREAKKKIEEHLAATLDNPEVALSVYAYNSKVYYVIHQGRENGDVVTRLPVTGNETVLDAISQVPGLAGMSSKQIWIARPKPSGAGCDVILPVNWQQIGPGAATATNYQVLPGDRIFVQETPLIERAAQGARKFLERTKAAEKPTAARQKAKDVNANYFIGDEY